jgi:hypothetical protein
MQKQQAAILWAIILSETSHIFCCVLPTLFSLFSILTNLGMFVMPGWFISLHEAMHAWEMPIVFASGIILATGWILYWQSAKGECQSGTCAHDKHHPKMKTTRLVLKIASVLFVVNVFVFLVIHRGMGISPVMVH